MAHQKNRKVTQTDSAVMNIRSVLSAKNNPEFMINIPDTVNSFKSFLKEEIVFNHINSLITANNYNTQIEQIRKLTSLKSNNIYLLQILFTFYTDIEDNTSCEQWLDTLKDNTFNYNSITETHKITACYGSTKYQAIIKSFSIINKCIESINNELGFKCCWDYLLWRMKTFPGGYLLHAIHSAFLISGFKVFATNATYFEPILTYFLYLLTNYESDEITDKEKLNQLSFTFRTLIHYLSNLVIQFKFTDCYFWPILKKIIIQLDQFLVVSFLPHDIYTSCSLTIFLLIKIAIGYESVDVYKNSSIFYSIFLKSFISESKFIDISNNSTTFISEFTLELTNSIDFSNFTPMAKLACLRSFLYQQNIIFLLNSYGFQDFKTLLFDVIIPLTARYTIDSYGSINFEITSHYLVASMNLWETILELFLYLLRNLDSFASKFNEIGVNILDRLLIIEKIEQNCVLIHSFIDSNWEHVHHSVSKTNQDIYLLLLDVTELIDTLNVSNDVNSLYWSKIIENNMSLKVNRRSKYLPLNALVTKIGAEKVLAKFPNFLLHLIKEANNVETKSICGTLVKQIVIMLLTLAKFESYDFLPGWMKVIYFGLYSSSTEIRNFTRTYILEPIVEYKPIFLIAISFNIENISYFLDLNDNILERKLIAFLTLAATTLSVNDSAAVSSLIWPYDDNSMKIFGSVNEILPYAHALATSYCSLNVELRLLTFDVLCSPHNRTTTLYKSWELILIKLILPFSLKLDSVAEKERLVRNIQKTIGRVRDSCKKHLADKKPNSNDVNFEASIDFILWLEKYLMSNIYPGAPVERLAVCLELYLSLIKIWGRSFLGIMLEEKLVLPSFTDQNFKSLLYCTSFQSWKHVRSLSFDILKEFPSPVVSLTLLADVNQFLSKAIKMIRSVKTAEVEGGVNMIRFLYCKYSEELRWMLPLFNHYKASYSNENYSCENIQIADSEKDACLYFWNQLHLCLDFDVNLHSTHISASSIADSNPTPSSISSTFSHKIRSHGLLLLSRFIIEDLNFSNMKYHSQWTILFKSFASKCIGISKFALNVHSNPLLRGCDLVTDFDDDDDKEPDTLENEQFDIDVDSDWNSSSTDEYLESLRRRVIMALSFHAVKEVTQLLGRIVAILPLIADKNSIPILNIESIKQISECFFEILFRSRHVGSINTAFSGWRDVCCKLRICPGEMYRLVDEYMTKLIDIVEFGNDKRITVLRRSAGFPFAFLGLMHSEPQHKPSIFISNSLSKLFTIANYTANLSSKVHAINVIRAVFRDRSFGNEINSFLADALSLSLNSFDSDEYLLRNAAMLNFKEFIARVFKCNNKSISSLSSSDLFRMCPQLYNILREHLNNTCLLNSNGSVNPALFPILLTLSKLLPINSASENDMKSRPLNSFWASLDKCAGSPNFLCRLMAARAVSSVVATNVLAEFISFLCSKLFSLSISFNFIHGYMLQIEELILGFKYRSSIDNNDTISHAVVILFNNFIDSKSQFYDWPASIRCIFYRILKSFSPYVSDNFIKIYSSFCIETCFREFDCISVYEPSQFDVKNDCFDLFFHICDFMNSSEHLGEVCDIFDFFQEILNLESPIVIVYVLDKLLKLNLLNIFGKKSIKQFCNIINSYIQNFKLKSYILHEKVLEMLCKCYESYLVTVDFTLQNYSYFVELCTVPDCQEFAIKLVAILFSMSIYMVDIAEFSMLMLKSIDDSNTFTLRYSTCEALSLSKFWSLDVSKLSMANQSNVINLWMCIVNSLQDDSEDIRNISSQLVFNLNNNSSIVSKCADLSISNVVEYLSSNFYHLDDLLIFSLSIFKNLLDSSDVLKIESVSNFLILPENAKEKSLTTVLYDSDACNAFREFTILSQLFSKSLNFIISKRDQNTNNSSIFNDQILIKSFFYVSNNFIEHLQSSKETFVDVNFLFKYGSSCFINALFKPFCRMIPECEIVKLQNAINLNLSKLPLVCQDELFSIRTYSF